nr:unnamed protein product [Mus musculus]
MWAFHTVVLDNGVRWLWDRLLLKMCQKEKATVLVPSKPVFLLMLFFLTLLSALGINNARHGLQQQAKTYKILPTLPQFPLPLFQTRSLASYTVFPIHFYLLHTYHHCDGLYMLGPESGTIRRYGPIGVRVPLWGWA